MVSAMVKKKKRATRRSKFNWPMIKNDWILNSLEHGGTLPLSDFLKKHKIAQGTFYKKMDEQNWGADLAKIKDKSAKSMLIKVEKQLVKTDSKSILDEFKVRVENFKIATTLVDPLIKEFQKRIKDSKNTDLKDIPLDKLIKGIQLCLDMRKQAAGLPDKLQVAMDLNENNDFQTVAGHIESHKDKMKLLGVISTLMKENKMLKDDSVDV